jgi:hypothetical protein
VTTLQQLDKTTALLQLVDKLATSLLRTHRDVFVLHKSSACLLLIAKKCFQLDQRYMFMARTQNLV